MLNNDKKTEEETVKDIKEILTSLVFYYRKYPLGANGDSADSTDVVEIVITDELAEFYAESLVYRGIGDVATLRQENEKLRLAFAKACDMLSLTCFRGYKIIKSDILKFVDDSFALNSNTVPEDCDIVLYEGKVGIFNILMKNAENSEERVGMLFMRGGSLLIPEDEFSKLKVLCRHNLANLRLMCMTQDELLQFYEKEVAKQ